jgi:uncharacterized protein
VIVLDTTVLAFAVGSDHPLADPARALLRAVGEGVVRATTTVEVIQEFAHVRARRRGRADAAALARDYATLLAPLITADADDLSAGLSLFEAWPRLGAFDAVLAAATRSRGADGLVSADRSFSGIDGVPFLALDSEAVARLSAPTRGGAPGAPDTARDRRGRRRSSRGRSGR